MLVWQAASRMAPNGPSHLVFIMPWNLPAHWVCTVPVSPLYVFLREYSTGDGTSFPRSGYKTLWLLLVSRFSYCCLSCILWRNKLPCWSAHLTRNLEKTLAKIQQGTEPQSISPWGVHLSPAASSDETLGLPAILLTALVVAILLYYTVLQWDALCGILYLQSLQQSLSKILNCVFNILYFIVQRSNVYFEIPG